MAAPITEIQRPEFTEDEIIEQKLSELKKQFANNEEAFKQMLDIIHELSDIGALEAANAMLQAKEKIAKIALEQVSREPVTNLLNTLMGATGAIMGADPKNTTKLISSAVQGMEDGHEFLKTEKKVRIFDLMKTLKDPDINRAIGFGIHFLKGMGKALKYDETQK